MKFLFFRSPIFLDKPGSPTFGYETKSYPPLGLLYIASALEAKGHKAEIIDLSFENPSESQLQKLLLSTDIVGLEVYSDNYKDVANFSKKIRSIDNDIPLIIGGPHCIFFQQKSLNHIPNSNISIVGEGEETINGIADYYKGRKKISNVNNIFYRENEKILSGNSFKVIENIDKLPYPARYLIEKYNYEVLPRGFVYEKKLTLMMTSRGCPHNCLFCSLYHNFIKGYGYRQRSAENVVGEILEIDRSYGSVLIVDDNFLADKKRAHKIFDMLIEHRTNLKILIMGARVDSAERELFIKMKKANVTFVGFGIESGNQDILDYYNKKISLKQIKKAVNLSNEMGFQTLGTIILGAPIETEEHLRRTIKFAKSIPLDFAFFTVLKYRRGSSLWSEVVKKRLVEDDEYSIPADSSKGLGNFTSEQLYEFSRKAYMSFYMRPSYVFNQIRKSINRKDFRMLKKSISFLDSIN